MGWVYLNGTTPVNYRNMIYADPNTGLSAFTDGVTFDVGTSANTHTGAVLAVNTWYHLCETVYSDGNASSHVITGYINAQQTIRVADTTTFSTYVDIGLGGNPNAPSGSFPLNGNLRDVRIWTRALSATEVRDEMNSSVPIHRPGLYIWSPLDKDLFADLSGNDNTWATTGTGIVLQSGPLKSFPKKRISFP